MNRIKTPMGPALGLDYIHPSIVTDAVEWFEGSALDVKKYVPVINSDYIFPRSAMTKFRLALNRPSEAVLIYGPTGCGKTSLVQQSAARLGMPLIRMNVSDATDDAVCFGMYKFVENGEMVFQYGPVAQAAKLGVPILLDEFGRGNPDKLIVLNGVLEKSGTFTIPGNGETVVPAEGFRIFLTDNTNLCADETGNYLTARTQDKSILDRIGLTIKLDYPVEEEKQLLTATLKKWFPDDKLLSYWFDQEGFEISSAAGIKKGTNVTREDFVAGISQVADMVRKQSTDGGNMSAAALERTMSVRVLLRWIEYCREFVGAPSKGESALHFGLACAMTDLCTPTTKIAIHAMVKSVFAVGEKLS